MKVNELREVIRQEVRDAIRSELKDLMVEAITIASAPTSIETPSLKKEQVEVKNYTPGTIKPIQDLLEETKLSFTSADARSFQTADLRQELEQSFNPNLNTVAMASKLGMVGENQPGLDLSSLPFLKNAKKILDVSNQKDKVRHGQ